MRKTIPVALVCGVVLLGGCSFNFSAGGSSVKKARLEKTVADQLGAKVGQQPKAVVCPGDLKGKQGTTMRCRLEAKDGTKYGVTVTVTSVKDNTINFDMHVDPKPLGG